MLSRGPAELGLPLTAAGPQCGVEKQLFIFLLLKSSISKTMVRSISQFSSFFRRARQAVEALSP